MLTNILYFGLSHRQQKKNGTDPLPKIAIFTSYKDDGGVKKLDPYTEGLKIRAKKLGIPLAIIHSDQFTLESSSSKNAIWHHGVRHEQSHFDVVLSRVGAKWITPQMYRVLDYLERLGARLPNPSKAIQIGEDKIQTHRILAKHGIPQPLTFYAESPLNREQLSQLGDKAIVKKNSDTSGGRDILVIPTSEVNQHIGPDVIVQKLEENDEKSSYRYVYIGGRCVSATVKKGGFGDAEDGTAVYEKAPMNPKLKALGKKVMEAVGLEVGSVDFLGTCNNPLVLEVNPSFGLVHFEKPRVLDNILNYLVREGKKHLARKENSELVA